MNKIIESEKIPIKLWLGDIEEGALQQAKNLANLPFAFHHIAVMPDAHVGYGMPIGGILAAKDAICPNSVGVDIGCGMCAVKTSLKSGDITLETLKRIMGEMRKQIPLGFEHHKKEQKEELMPKMKKEKGIDYKIVNQEYKSALKQIGTLGGGNHFLEIQKGHDGSVWLMIHSGSRNIGKKVADYYNKIAIDMNARMGSSVPPEWQLAYLPTKTMEAKNYLAEMQYCVEFALANRELMIERIENIFRTVFYDKIKFDKRINIAHNYASYEKHFGKMVWVHRKGATSARVGELGIIPGSQGTKSYIVSGKGNVESYMSCSHGSGRVMGREEAKRTLSVEKEKALLDAKGILHAIRGKSDLEEAPSAYKDINVVIENQKDLADVLVELEPMAVIKG